MATQNTITDQDDFSVSLINQEKFDNLSDDEKLLFKTIRNSMLEIFPLNSESTFDTVCVGLAENFAFININAFNIFYENRIETELTEIRESLIIEPNVSTEE